MPPPVLKALQLQPAVEGNLWLVGGALRDSLLERETEDFDFAVAGDARRLARAIADAVGGAYFDLDAERDAGRVMAKAGSSGWRTLDFASLRAADISADLRLRDFTVNAMALAAYSQELIDPTGGLGDVKEGLLRMCSPTSLADDPLRAVRAVRLASELGFRLDPALVKAIPAARERVDRVSVERRRQELFRMLDLPRPAGSLRAAHQLRLLPALLPALPLTRLDAGLDTLGRLGDVLSVLIEAPDPDRSGDLVVAQLSLRLGRYRSALAAELAQSLAGGRRRLQLLNLAALGVGGCEGGAGGLGAGLSETAERLRLSRLEVAHLARIEQFFSEDRRPLLEAEPGRRRVFRHYEKLGEAGLEVILLALACFLAGEAGPPEQNAWAARIEAARGYLGPRLEGPAQWLNPPSLLVGDELIDELGLRPGPVVGRLLGRIREAQAAGEIKDRAGALALARRELAAEPGSEGASDQG